MEYQQSPDSAVKMTSWANEPTIITLKNDHFMAKPSHDAQVSKIKDWGDMMAVKGRHKPQTVKGRSSVQPKVVRRQAEWRYSALTEPFLGSNKPFDVKPTTSEDGAGARQNELLLNWQFRTKLNRVKFIDDFVRATVDEGTSIVRVGWKRVTTKIKKTVPVYDFILIEDEETLAQFQQALEMRDENIRGFLDSASPELKAAVDYYLENEQPVLAEQVGEEVTTIDKIIENRPTLEVKNPANVMIDPSCNGDLDKALFVIESFETNQSELKKEGKRYKNLDKVNWEGNTPLTQPDHETSTPSEFQFADSKRKKVVAHEYWGFFDIHNNGSLTPIIVTWIGDVIIRMEENPYPDEKVPYVVVPYLPVKRELHGEPDAEFLEDNQKIIGAIMRGAIDSMGRSANAQQGMAKGMLDPLNRRRFEQGQDYEYNPNTNPQQGLIEHKYPEIPNSVMMMLGLQNQEAEALTGVKSFSGGISGEAYGEVAAGIRGALDAASKREMAILRRLAKGLMEIGAKIIAMNAIFLSEEEVVRVTNEEFVVIKREDLKGNYDLEVDISTAEVDNQKSQDLAFMLQTMGNTVEPGIAIMVLSEIARLKRMPELAKRLEKFKPEPSPEQVKLQELEIRNKELENEKLESEIALNKAKAVEAKAKAEQADLDFVEQESGTKHARDLQKQGGQARANQDLEVTKALLKGRKPDEKEPDVEAAVGFNEFTDGKNDVNSSIERDRQAPEDPSLSLGSRFFEPELDPSLNPAMNM